MRFASKIGFCGISLLLLLIGCGGGGSSHSSLTGGGVSTTGGTSGGGSLSATQRQTVMNSISTAITALPSSADGALHNQAAIVAILKRTSGITDVTAQTNGNVSGKFSDGVPFCVINNVPSDGDPTLPPNPIYTDESSVESRSIPATGNVMMLNGFGDAFAMPGSQDVAMFQANGYSVSSGRATVTALRSLGNSGSKIGVLFLSGHGGDASTLPQPNAPSSGFGIWTATKYDPNTWASYSADVTVNQSLGFMLAANNYVRSASGDVVVKNGVNQIGQEWHYAILPPFLQEYKWKLASDSLVMLNACSGGSAEAGLFQSALHTAGASMIAAWTQIELVKKGFQSASYLFDRMLGANVIEPLVTKGNPPRRSFSFTESKTASDSDQLTNYMFSITYPGINGGKPYSYPYNPVLIPILPSGTTASSDQFTILKPALLSEGLYFPAKGGATQFQANGYFGIPGGKNTTVTVGSTTLTASPVTNTSLTATASSSISGFVTVHVKRGDGKVLDSNTRNLSGWSSKVVTTFNSFGQTSGSTVVMSTFNAHFAADLQSRYDTPDQLVPTAYSVGAVENGKSVYPIVELQSDTLTVNGSGTLTTVNKDPQGNVIYSDTQTLGGGTTIKLTGTAGGFSHVALSLPPNPGQPAYIQIAEDTPDVLSYNETIFENGASSSTSSMINAVFETSYFTGDNGDVWYPITIDKNYNISMVDQTRGTGGPGSGVQEIMSVPAMTCTSPPVTNTAR